MRCPGCEYDLEGCPRWEAGDGERVTCPECGAVVDPAAAPAGSGRESTARMLFWIAGVLALTPLAAHAMAHLALIVARVELGRWPHRMGRDDPKGIDAAEPFMSLAFLLLLLAVGSLLLQGVILIWIA